MIKSNDLNKNLHIFDINSKKKIILISIKKNLKNFNIENLGAELFGKINIGKNNEYVLIKNINIKYKNFIDHFLHGLRLKSY